MQEQQHQIKIYGFFQKMVYFTVTLDCLILFYAQSEIPVVSNLLKSFGKMGFFYPPLHAKIATVILVALVGLIPFFDLCLYLPLCRVLASNMPVLSLWI